MFESSDVMKGRNDVMIGEKTINIKHNITKRSIKNSLLQNNRIILHIYFHLLCNLLSCNQNHALWGFDEKDSNES